MVTHYYPAVSPVKVRSSKEQQRHQLERDMERYLSKGGKIKEIPVA